MEDEPELKVTAFKEVVEKVRKEQFNIDDSDENTRKGYKEEYKEAMDDK